MSAIRFTLNDNSEVEGVYQGKGKYFAKLRLSICSEGNSNLKETYAETYIPIQITEKEYKLYKERTSKLKKHKSTLKGTLETLIK